MVDLTDSPPAIALRPTCFLVLTTLLLEDIHSMNEGMHSDLGKLLLLSGLGFLYTP